VDLDFNNEVQSWATALEREGIKLEKQKESEILIKELFTLMDSTPEKVDQRCRRLYSMQTFLFPQLNHFLHEADRTKIETSGSFVRLLCFYFNHSSFIEVHSIEVYRGMNLSLSMIDAKVVYLSGGLVLVQQGKIDNLLNISTLILFSLCN
jgi:hypothetical protein